MRLISQKNNSILKEAKNSQRRINRNFLYDSWSDDIIHIVI